jgi:hypothetical protein
MQALKTSILWIEIDSTLISLLQIVADMKEACALEGVSKVTNLGISSCEASEPIIGHTDSWDLLSLAAVFEHSLSEDSDLLHDVARLSIRVWAREHISIVEEDHLYSFDHALMHSEGEAIPDADVDVVNVSDAGWVFTQVSSLSLSIPLIVRRNDDDLLAQISESDGQLVNHDTESTNSGPSAKLRGGKHDWSELIGVMDSGSCLRWCNHLPSSLLQNIASHGNEPT